MGTFRLFPPGSFIFPIQEILCLCPCFVRENMRSQKMESWIRSSVSSGATAYPLFRRTTVMVEKEDPVRRLKINRAKSEQAMRRSGRLVQGSKAAIDRGKNPRKPSAKPDRPI